MDRTSAARRFLDRTIETIGGLMLLAVTVLAIIQVILRYIFNYAIIWSEEFSRLLFVWIVMLGAALGLSYGKHMVIEFVQQRLPRVIGDVVTLALQVLGLVFLGVVLFKGVPLLELTSTDFYVTLPFPVMYAYLAAVVGAGLMMIYWIGEMIVTIKRLLHRADGQD